MKNHNDSTRRSPSISRALAILFIAAALLLSGAGNGFAEEESKGWLGRLKDFASSAEEEDIDERHSFITVDEVRRKYYLHLPKGRTDTQPIPLIIAFHSGHGGGIRLSVQSGFDELADKEGFAVVYPDSVDQWNDGRAKASSMRDIKLTKALIKKLVKENNIDPKRIYATGVLNGGIFTLRLACDMADDFAGFAPLLGSMPEDYVDSCRPSRRVPLMLVSATGNRMVPWKGGSVPFGGSFTSGGNVIAIDKTIQFWQEHNDCSPAAFTELLPDIDKNDGTRVEVARYKNCYKGSALTHVIVKNGGSIWPGSREKSGRMRTTMIGLTSYDIDATAMIWEFFKKNTPKQK
ncbi:hypothetical protein MNBD_DELTA01-713 [hydrothermal vent metagenome]|uniref:Uncharacterized protein n=1 Tax=hydrothermal vent metagenome TaxID=652676 RepID=A0A3B0RHD0_9ZZZZ